MRATHAVLMTQQTTQPIEASVVDSYRENGFVRVRNVLSPEQVERYAAAARGFAERQQAMSYTQGDDAKVFTQFVNVWQHDDTLRDLTLNNRLADIARQLAGVPLRLWHDQLLIKQPRNEAATEFHQDAPYWPHAASRCSLTAWVALVDVPVERGCMSFLPGSHEHTGLRRQDLRDREDLFRADPELRWHARVTLPLRAGDCTFHNSYTGHMAGPNSTDDPRFGYAIIYMDAETRYAGTAHTVTDSLDLSAGDALDTPEFPTLPAE